MSTIQENWILVSNRQGEKSKQLKYKDERKYMNYAD